MRKVLMLVAGLGLAFSLAFPAGDAAAKTISVKITQQQMANVCGKNVSTGGGHSGCGKACGSEKQYQCDFDCNNKTGQCTGTCLTCESPRLIGLGKDSPKRVIKHSVRAAP